MKLRSNSIKSTLAQVLRDESGQSTTEYVLLLLFVVIAVKQVGGTLKEKLTALVSKVFATTEGQIGTE